MNDLASKTNKQREKRKLLTWKEKFPAQRGKPVEGRNKRLRRERGKKKQRGRATSVIDPRVELNHDGTASDRLEEIRRRLHRTTASTTLLSAAGTHPRSRLFPVPPGEAPVPVKPNPKVKTRAGLT